MTYSVPVPRSDRFSWLKSLLKSKSKRKPKKPKKPQSFITIFCATFLCVCMGQIGFHEGLKMGLYTFSKNLSNFDSIVLYFCSVDGLFAVFRAVIYGLAGVGAIYLDMSQSVSGSENVIKAYQLIHVVNSCCFIVGYCLIHNSFAPWLGLTNLFLGVFLMTLTYEGTIILLKIPDDRDHDDE